MMLVLYSCPVIDTNPPNTNSLDMFMYAHTDVSMATEVHMCMLGLI